jgi:DNA-binding beta-propeller fold protein YncE
MKVLGSMILALGLAACGQPPNTGLPPPASGGGSEPPVTDAGNPADAGDVTPPVDAGHPTLPLELVMETHLPGNSTRFDYQDVDSERGILALAHMNDNEVLVLNTVDGSVVGRIPNVSTPRGVIMAPTVNRIFASAVNGQVVAIDATTFTEASRATTGTAPDGVGWDPEHQVVATSDQGAGALSLIASAGTGTRIPVPLGAETGNVIYDPTRSWFWVTVVRASGPDQLAGVDPVTGNVLSRYSLSGCSGAHGLRLHPDGQTAFIACEGNDVLVRLDLATGTMLGSSPTGTGVDVLAVDPGLMWLYAASESGVLVVFDIAQDGLVNIDRENVGANAHSVAVDPKTHHVFFPLMHGADGHPAMRIMKPQTK